MNIFLNRFISVFKRRSQDNEFKEYTDQLVNRSDDFNSFMYNYFTGPIAIRGRREEDTGVWSRLEGIEYEVAKQMILDNLSTGDAAYITAVSIFKDERAIPILENLVVAFPQQSYYARTLTAKILYEWIGFEDYFTILDDSLLYGGQYTKTEILYWIHGIQKEKAMDYIFRMLNDNDSFVRWCAYGAMKKYLNLGEQEYEETKYYTSDEVYENKELFNKRLNELHKMVTQEGIDFI
ncbi:hypothetical protein [Cohnella sp. WQ 127256]|uniref:hypothetical protein n=1 Tax=Cohnella sp. WQ 127256 TaxID=2938790 RepID=UPI002118B707|nr:hypothetical protein [Cohnella sp. WQ 127256]